MLIESDGIKTYSNAETLEALTELGAAVPEGLCIVEVGVYRAGTTCALASEAKAHVYGIDTWGLEGAYSSGSESAKKYGLDNMEIAERRIEGRGLSDKITLIRNFSAEAAADWDGPPIGLLFIDGEHTYDAVHNDYAAWAHYVPAGGIVAFDDYTNKPQHAGVRMAVGEILAQGFTDPQVSGKRLLWAKRSTS